MYFSFLSFLSLSSCMLVLWPFIDINCTLFSYIYDDVCVSSPISTCVVSFLSLYTCFFMYEIFISVSHMMPWWVLFKCFRKADCESLPCHEFSSCEVFQEFMLGLDSFCNSTSDYEFSGLRLLSWFILFCCGFVTDCQRGRLLGKYFM